MMSFLVILAWLIVELPFAVRVEDGTPVPTEVLQMAHNTGCTSIAERRIENYCVNWHTEGLANLATLQFRSYQINYSLCVGVRFLIAVYSI